MDRFSHAWLPRAFGLTRRGYYLDFALMPLIAAALIARELSTAGPSLLLFDRILFGAVVWTLAEYLIHRFVFHGATRYEKMHHVHHERPAAWVGVGSWGTILALFCVWVLLGMIGPSFGNAVTAGLVLGYLFYIVVHDRYHHGNRRAFGRYVRFMDRHHAGHHRSGDVNFGVSSPVWDYLFGTYRRTPR